MSPESGPFEMSNTSQAFTFAKLNGANYATWADHMQAALQSKYLWLIVKGSETRPAEPLATRPTATSQKDYKEEKRDYLDWSLRDEAAQGNIKNACEDSQLPHIKDATSAKHMWDTLKKIHITNHARINAHYAFEDLYTRKYLDGAPMADHVAAMLDVKRQIEDAGETLEDLHLARALVLSLPKTQSWDIIKIQLFDMEPNTFTADTVSSKLQSEANRRAREAVGADTALYVQKKEPRKRDGSPDPFYACRNNGHQGHGHETCPHHYKHRKRAPADTQAKAAP